MAKPWKVPLSTTVEKEVADTIKDMADKQSSTPSAIIRLLVIKALSSSEQPERLIA
jgi:hypothetical protein